MSLWDKVKDIMSIPDEDEFEEEELSQPAAVKRQPIDDDEAYAPKKSENVPRVHQGGRARSNSYSTASRPQVQVVLVKPERFDDVPPIADHLNDKKTVVLNLECADRDTSRRIIDFLSGVTYANKGNIRKIANATYIIVPTDVDVTGELMLEDYEDGKLYL